MSKNNDLYGDNFDDDNDDQGSNDLVSQLRRANKAQAKSLKELTEKYDAAETARADLSAQGQCEPGCEDVGGQRA